MSLPIVYHRDYMAPLKPGHRFPMSKYGYLRETLVRDAILPARGGYLAPAPASAETLAAVHDAAYVDRVLSGSLAREEERRIGLPQSAAMVRRVRLSASGTTLAGRLALAHGVACNAAGGSHHAGPDGGAGFCVFNDVAVAARTLLAEGVVRRVLVVDLDVHQGDGTARIFADDPRVFTLSVHAARNFPARKAISDRDVALPDGLGDAAYLAALGPILEAAITASAPDLAFYNAGVDPHDRDRLGRLALTDAGLAARDALVLARLRAAGVPVAGVLGGGYDDDVPALGARHATLFRAAAAYAA